MAEPSPLGAVARGLAAGATATAVMSGYQLLVAKLRGQSDSPQPQSWEEAPAPAQIGQRVLTGVFQKQVGLAQAQRLANAMHWAYGSAWGGIYGLFQGTTCAAPLRAGAAFGAGVWGMSYAQLVPMGIYEPPWKYPAKELALDLSYHLVYGIAAALAYETFTPTPES
ncbi:MAG: hypothetical protein ABR569_07105 [Gaiellaceae bacterium]